MDRKGTDGLSTVGGPFVWRWTAEGEMADSKDRLAVGWRFRTMFCSAFWWQQCGMRSHHNWIKASRYCDNELFASDDTRSPVVNILFGFRAIVCPRSRLSDNELSATGKRLRDRPVMLSYLSKGYGVLPLL